MPSSPRNSRLTPDKFHEADERVRRNLAEVGLWLEARHNARFLIQGLRHVAQNPDELCAVVVLGSGDVSARLARDEALIALRGLGQDFNRVLHADGCCVEAADVSHYSAHERVAAISRVEGAFERERVFEGKCAAIDSALEDAEQGRFISSEAVNAWIESWDTKSELPAPEVDVTSGST